MNLPVPRFSERTLFLALVGFLCFFGFFLPMVPGCIAKKVGMSRVFLDSGEAVAVTYLQVEPNTVVRVKTAEKDGYNAIVLGVDPREWKTRKGKTLVRYGHQKEWKIDSIDGVEAGKPISLDAFAADVEVAIAGVSKGKGFQGVMRRHHFHGGPRSHGSHFKREPGSVGMRAQPGRIFKGHRMAGRMGGDHVTLHNRPIVVADATQGLIAVRGPVPGPTGTRVELTIEPSFSAQ
jgi:large subunit ribosomal protein L3